tara:strand:- start:269 stop:2479 length:2211 start_codon:yes stop_codon:yes gene_type:complete
MSNRPKDKPLASTVIDGDNWLIDSTATGVRRIPYETLKHIFNGENPDVTAGDGTDYSTAIQTYLTAGRRVELPRGNIRIDSGLTIPSAHGGIISGAGIDRTFLDATQAGAFSFVSSAVIYGTGSYTQLVNLGSNASRGEKTLSFVSAPDCAANDLIFIYNPTDYSFSNWRDVYRAGEFAKVASVSGNVVTLQGLLHDDYAYGDVAVYKVTPVPVTLRDLTILCPGDANMAGVSIALSERLRLDNVAIIGAGYACLSVSRGYGYSIQNCYMVEDMELDSGGTDYGAVIGNSQEGQIVGGQYSAARHAIAHGGADVVGAVPTTNVDVRGVKATTTGTTSWAIDGHGNTRGMRVIDCDVIGGMSIGGKKSIVAGGRIYASSNQGSGETPVYYTELVDCNHTITGAEIWSSSDDANRGQFIDVGGNDVTTLNADTATGGLFCWTNLRLHYEGTATGGRAIKVFDRGYAQSTPINLVLENIVSKCANETLRRGPVLDLYVSSSSSEFGRVDIQNINHHGSGPVIDGQGNDATRIDSVHHTGCIYTRGSGAGVGISSVSGRIFSQDNQYIDQVAYSYLQGSQNKVNTVTHIHSTGERFFDAFQTGEDSGAESAQLLISYANLAMVRGLDVVNNNQKMNVADSSGFAVDDVITGGTSGATATVVGKDEDSNVLFLGTTVSGTFQISETITEPGGGSTTVSSLPEAAHEYAVSGVDLVTLRRRDTVCVNSRGVFKSNVTTDTQD